MWTTQYVKFCNIPCNYQQYWPSQRQKRGHVDNLEALKLLLEAQNLNFIMQTYHFKHFLFYKFFLIY